MSVWAHCFGWTYCFHWQISHEKAGGDKGFQKEVGLVATSAKQLRCGASRKIWSWCNELWCWSLVRNVLHVALGSMVVTMLGWFVCSMWSLGTGGVSSFTIGLHHERAFKQPLGAPTASPPRALWCLYWGGGHCVGRSVTEARGQGSVVVLAAEQEVSAATRLRYASYTSTCQFILWTDGTKTVSITCKSHNVSGFLYQKLKNEPLPELASSQQPRH